MALVLALGLGHDGLQQMLVRHLNFFVVVGGETLNNVHGNSIDVALLKVADVLNQALDALSGGEEATDGLVDREVCWADT